MTNREIIKIALCGTDFEYDGENLKTFAEWRKAGYYVKKGEKAFIKVCLWKKHTRTTKDEDGKEKKETKYYKHPASLFARDQVESFL